MEYKDTLNDRFTKACLNVIKLKLVKNKARLADALDIKSNKLSEILSGRMRAGVSEIQKLCNIYNVSFLYIFNNDGEIFNDKNVHLENIRNLSTQNGNLSTQNVHLEDKNAPPFKPTLKKPQNPKQKPQIETPDIENGGLVVPIVGKSFDRRVERQEVPLYDFDAVAGLTPVFNGQGNPVDYISIPNLAKVDGAVPICGDSMYPLLKSGDIVMYKIVNDFTNIIWGEMYLISISYDDDEYISVKYLRKSENSQKSVILASYNPNHAPKEIPIECIRSLALIKAVIHFNVM